MEHELNAHVEDLAHFASSALDSDISQNDREVLLREALNVLTYIAKELGVAI